MFFYEFFSVLKFYSVFINVGWGSVVDDDVFL